MQLFHLFIHSLFGIRYGLMLRLLIKQSHSLPYAIAQYISGNILMDMLLVIVNQLSKSF